ncbi:MAG: hypothetical protein WCX65_11020 [bacterium]
MNKNVKNSEKHTGGSGRRAAGFAFDIALFAIALAALLAIAEIAFRFADIYPPLEKNRTEDFRKGLDIFRIDPDVLIPISMRPGERVSMKATGVSEPIAVRTNNLGMRGADAAREKGAGVYRALIMGDSWTFGEGVKDSETFSARLGEILNRKLAPSGRRAEALNAGYTAGYSPDTYYVYMQQKGFALEPDIVIVASMPVNDLFDISNNDWPEKDARGLPLSVASRMLRINKKGQYGNFENKNADNPIMRPSRFRFLNRLRLNTFYRDLLFRTYYLPYVMKNKSAGGGERQRSGFENMKRLQLAVEGLDAGCRARGVKFLLVLLPAFGYERGKLTVNSTGMAEMENFCRRKGIRTLNLEKEMLKKMRAPEGYDWPRYHITGNGHWNARGHAAAAEAIARAMARYGMIPEK